MVPWVSKMKGSKSLNKRRTFAYCLTPIKILGLVYIRGREKIDRKIVEVNMEFFVSGDRIQKYF